MIKIEQVKFFDEYTGTAGVASKTPNYCIGDKATIWIYFYLLFSAEHKRIVFDSASKTLTNGNALDRDSFMYESDGQVRFQIGDTFETDSITNPGPFTITDITDTVITVSEAVSDETLEDVSLFCTTPITEMQFFYNFIQLNGYGYGDFNSLVDTGTPQRFSASGLDASNVTPVNCFVDTDSFGWVTNNLLDEETGETNEVTIQGVSITDYKQKFLLKQDVLVTPTFLRQYFNNLTAGKTPDIIPLNYSFSLINPVNSAQYTVAHPVIRVSNGGYVCWFNQNNTGKRPDYYIDSVVYTDVVTNEVVDAPDIKRTTLVEITMKSRSGLFDTGDPFCLNVQWCSMNQEDYINTSTTENQNFLYDRLFFNEGDAPANGEMYGTDYQNIVGASADNLSGGSVDPFTTVITFTLDPSTHIENILASRGELNRYFLIWLTTQSVSVTTPLQTTRTATYIFENALYNQDDDSLFELVDHVRVYESQDLGYTEQGTIVGTPGEPFNIEVPFRVETAVVNGVSPTIQKVGIQVLAKKTGATDFVLEEKFLDVSQIRKLLGVQDIDIEGVRGFKAFDDDRTNLVSLANDTGYDSGSMAGFLFRYGFILRYENWREVLPVDDSASIDIFQDITDVTQLWSNYNNVEGWNLYLRFQVSVLGYDEHVTDFYTDVPMTVNASGSTPEVGPALTVELEYLAESTEFQPITITKVAGLFAVIDIQNNGISLMSGNATFNWTDSASAVEGIINALLNTGYAVDVDDSVTDQFTITLIDDTYDATKNVRIVNMGATSFDVDTNCSVMGTDIQGIVAVGTTRIRAKFTGAVDTSITGSIAQATFAIGAGAGTLDVQWNITEYSSYPDPIPTIVFDTADVAGTQALFDAMLAQYFPGLSTSVFTYGFGKWDVTIDTNETDRYNGLTQTITCLSVSISSSAFSGGITPVAGVYGSLFADVINTGGIYTRRWATTEYESESDSPWSAPGADPYANTSYANGNLRMNIYEGEYILVEGFFDSTMFADNDALLIYPQLGYRQEPIS